MVPRHQNQTNTPTEILMGFTQGIVCAHMYYFLQAHVITTIIAFRLPGKLLYMLMLWATWDIHLYHSFTQSHFVPCSNSGWICLVSKLECLVCNNNKNVVAFINGWKDLERKKQRFNVVYQRYVTGAPSR